MKLLNEDYDFENRITNIMWTVCEDYNQVLDINEKNFDSKNAALYFAVLSGARKKYIEWDLVKLYLKNRVNRGVNKEIISNLIQIGGDIFTEKYLIKERPGVVSIRNSAYEEIFKKFAAFNNNTVIEKLKCAVIFEQMGRHPSLDSKTLAIFRDMKKIENSMDTLSFLRNIDEIYAKYFDGFDSEICEVEYIENKESKKINPSDFWDFINDELYNNNFEEETEEEINEITSSMLIDGVGKIKDENITNLSDKRVVYVDEENREKIYEKIEFYYGASFLNINNQKNLERICYKGIHKNCKIHFTDGVLRTNSKNNFQIKYVSKHKEHNLFEYRENIRIYNTNIKKLRNAIRTTLLKEKESIKVESSSGNLNPCKLWRVNRTNNPKIFTKEISNEKGNYVVDILLDASGSQRKRQAKVAIQGYIISKALTGANIPNRVMSFCSFLDYTILRRYRDYDSCARDDYNIFEYFCAGNNRDGLAIKSVCEGLKDRSEENKILIVLSDGRPNDIKIGKKYDDGILDKYSGMIAIKDTANEVRRARANNVKVLGVYTGKEEDIKLQKIIYGRDFVYTKNIERFSHIVAVYLKKIIED